MVGAYLIVRLFLSGIPGISRAAGHFDSAESSVKEELSDQDSLTAGYIRFRGLLPDCTSSTPLTT